ncbi:unnamed protein product [Schistocephalus solidus]|uniref:Plug domain-containing protein n=1 Tax=Schistocephalus solidus TaxID=70667 RepID=A0A183TBH6_SCHSO|nr:unnamed protein product [Schistocephalus solidus]
MLMSFTAQGLQSWIADSNCGRTNVPKTLAKQSVVKAAKARLTSGDPFGLIDCCTYLRGSSPRLSILGEVLPGRRVDLKLLPRFLQGVLIASFLTFLSVSTRSDISVENSFGKSLVVHSHQVASTSQLHLPQHGVDAEDSGSLQDFHVQDPLWPSQLQYSAEAAEMEVIQIPGLVRVDGSGFRSVKECLQDDGLVHF